MNFDDAMKAAAEGQQMMLPHWHWVYVSRNQRGGMSLFEEEGTRRVGRYRPTADERRATDWQVYQHNMAGSVHNPNGLTLRQLIVGGFRQ